MDNNDVIRLNVKVHPDKDPALYQLLTSISREARSRRFMNLASTGLLFEQNGISPSTQSKPVIAKFEGNESSDIDVAPQLTASENTIASPMIVDEEELDAIGDIFSKS